MIGDALLRFARPRLAARSQIAAIDGSEPSIQPHKTVVGSNVKTPAFRDGVQSSQELAVENAFSTTGSTNTSLLTFRPREAAVCVHVSWHVCASSVLTAPACHSAPHGPCIATEQSRCSSQPPCQQSPRRITSSANIERISIRRDAGLARADTPRPGLSEQANELPHAVYIHERTEIRHTV